MNDDSFWAAVLAILLVNLLIWGGIAYVVIHFVGKFW